jgi:hypothetical protein
LDLGSRGQKGAVTRIRITGTIPYQLVVFSFALFKFILDVTKNKNVMATKNGKISVVESDPASFVLGFQAVLRIRDRVPFCVQANTVDCIEVKRFEIQEAQKPRLGLAETLHFLMSF